MTIYDELKKNANRRLPMHMPGHKRRASAEYLEKLACDLDVTEIDGFDDLCAPTGIIAEAERRAAALYGAEHSFLLVGGSTLGILAGMYTVLRRGDVALIARNCHRSVYNAVEVCGAVPRYILPKPDENGIFSDISPKDVEDALKECGAKLVVVTSPTYEGVISDVASIKKVCKRYGALLLVDAAHGAHLDLSEHFTGGAVKAGADITVCSLHKTLPSLTQTAAAHVNGVDEAAFRRSLSVFGTSSPSYLLMASADGCVDLIGSHPEYFAEWRRALDGFYEKAKRLSRLSVFDGGGAFGFDRSKIVILTRDTSLSGFGLADLLRSEGIEPEMAAVGYTVCMTGISDREAELDRLLSALMKADGQAGGGGAKIRTSPTPPEYRMSPSDARQLPSESVLTEEAAGRISAEYICAYPPGIPLIVPGETFDRSVTEAARSVIFCGGRIISSDKTLKTVKVINSGIDTSANLV